jgi:hypothetical protein
MQLQKPLTNRDVDGRKLGLLKQRGVFMALGQKVEVVVFVLT